LAARAKLTYLDRNARNRVREVTADELLQSEPALIPDFDLRDKWFHNETFLELRKIRHFIDTRRVKESQQFLLATYSSIITACTGRRGKEHGYFADNAPLEKGLAAPPYQNAIALFLSKLSRNLSNIESFYAAFERQGKSAAEELARASVIRANVQSASVSDYGLDEHTVAAIITSPPYLCMADYTLGQR